MPDKVPHWSNDRYWLDAIARYQSISQGRHNKIVLDLKTIESFIFNGTSPAYKLVDAMHSVHIHEGWEGNKGAPRLVLGLLALLAEHSNEDDLPQSLRSLDIIEWFQLNENEQELLDNYTRVIYGPESIDIEVARIEWHGPHEPHLIWDLVAELPLAFRDGRVFDAQRAVLKRRKYFKRCQLCKKLNASGHMFDANTCGDCASEHLRVVY